VNNYLKIAAITVLSSTNLSACFDGDNEIDIALSEVPANVVTIIQNTLPGISLTEAEKEIKDDAVTYELEGKLIDGKEYEIKITEDGTIIKIELED
jgi:uncharacterized membrane protein YkoI